MTQQPPVNPGVLIMRDPHSGVMVRYDIDVQDLTFTFGFPNYLVGDGRRIEISGQLVNAPAPFMPSEPVVFPEPPAIEAPTGELEP